MRTVRLITVWALYILGLPVLILWTIGIILWACISNMRDFRELCFIESIKALFKGYKEGHKINMIFVENGKTYYMSEDAD